VKELIGIKESDTGLSLPSQWDLVSDKQMMQEEQPLQVGERERGREGRAGGREEEWEGMAAWSMRSALICLGLVEQHAFKKC
jgi:hypothetical protein